MIMFSSVVLGQTSDNRPPQVLRDDLQAQWSEDGQWLKYSIDTTQNGIREHFKVNLASGEKSPVSAEEQAADTSSVQACLTRAARSSSGGEDTSFEVVNRLSEPLECWWLSTDGNAVKYQTVAPQAKVAQHTFIGHVWSLRNGQGDELVRFSGQPANITLVVDAELLMVFDKLPLRSNERGARTGRRRNREEDVNSSGLRASIRSENVWIKTETSHDWEPLTTDGTADNRYRGPLMISPSGRYLAVIQEQVANKREVHVVESSPEGQVQPKLHTFEYVKPGDPIDAPRVRLFDLESRQPVSFSGEWFDNLWSITELRWITGPERMVCLVNERGHQRLRLLAFNPSSAEVQVLVEETSETFIDYSNKVRVDWLNDSRSFLWMTERSGYNHLLHISADDGQVVNAVTSGSWVVRDIEHIDHEAKRVWFEASGIVPGQDPYYRHQCRVNLDGSDLSVLSEGDGDHRCEFSPDRRWFIDRYSRVDLPPVAVLRDAESGQAVCELERSQWDDLLHSGWSVPERLVAKGRDGQTDIYGVIVRPSQLEPGKKYPVVEKIYAGPHSAHVPKSFSLLKQEHELADLGMIIVLIDGMGTSHRGKKFHDMCWKNLADAGFPDRIAWIKAAANQYAEMDLSRVGIFGGSAGGQNALRALIDHHDFYQVAVADCGCHDNRMDKIWWNEAWMGWPIDQSYERSSNVEQAARMEGKLMLIVGELDRNVDPASTMQVVDALVKADKVFDLVIIPGAGHGAAETTYGSRRRRDFLVEHLIGHD